MLTINDFSYRADIDGLRAVAVLAVVLFHADLGCTGGYIGVDVFFVISGFLITSLIWKDLEKGRFTFTNFWERRARRIIPPLVVLTFITLVAGYFFLLPSSLIGLGKAAVTQSFFGANIYYWLDSGYFSTGAEEKPLLHTWSLAVEEQFYLIVPFLFWKIFRLIQTRFVLISVLVSAFILSFVMSIYGVSHSPSATFYLLPTRAWELLIGAIVAFLPKLITPRYIREMIAILGIILIFLSIFLYTDGTPFPGIAALPPCLGTALLIYANATPTIVGSILSRKPIVFIGLISYSLYLWHWMFFAYGKYLSIEPLSVMERMLMVIFGFLFAVLSWKYIENPFRKRKIAASRKTIFTYTGIGMLSIFVCGLLLVVLNGFPQRFSTEKLKFADAVSDEDFINELTVDDIHKNNLPLIGASDKLPSVIIWGDSHAMAAAPAFDIFLKEKGISGQEITHSSTPPVIGWYQPQIKITAHEGDIVTPLNEQSVEFNDATIFHIKKNKIKNVILIAAWGHYTKEYGFNTALLTTIRQVTETGAKVWILLDVPIPSFNVPRALSRSNYSLSYLNSLYLPANEFDSEFVAEMKAAGANILDPKPLFMNSEGYYIIQSQGTALYRDDNHLTSSGAKLILLPFFENQLVLATK